MIVSQRAHRINVADISIHLNGYASEVDSDALRRWTVHVLLEEVDVVATELCPPGNWHVLPELPVEIDMRAEDFLRDTPGFRALLRDAIRTQLHRSLTERSSVSETWYFSSTLLEYLASGTLPAGRSADRLHTALTYFMENFSTMDQDLHARLFAVLKQTDGYTRFMRHIGDAPLYELLHMQSGAAPDLWRRVLRALPPVLRKHPAFWRTANHDALLRQIFAILPEMATERSREIQEILRRLLATLRLTGTVRGAGQTSIPSEVMADMAEALSAAGLPSDMETVAELFSLPPAANAPEGSQADTKSVDLPASALHIAHAGVILLAPFLQTFLSSVDGLDDKGRLRAPERLPIFLHYLATGERAAEEWQLSLHKILAGLEINALCDTELLISEEEVLQTSDLLHSVIGLWDKLQGTTIAGLRETFLQRPGTLSPQSPNWRLRVREEAVDILLQFVPWPFHTVRLPWMHGIVLVDW